MDQQTSPILVGFGLVLALAVGVAAVVMTGPGFPAPRAGLPAPVDPSPTTVEKPAKVVPDDSGIPGVVAYDSQGWPISSGTPGADSLPHDHASGPIAYSVTPPMGGDHNAKWMNCGVYSQPVPSERAVHNLEHGAVWITYRPDLPAAGVEALKAFVRRQLLVVLSVKGQMVDTHQRYIDLSPFPGLPAPIVISSWAHQLRVRSPGDPRLGKFVETFRVSPKYSPEYGPTCQNQPPALGGVPEFS